MNKKKRSKILMIFLYTFIIIFAVIAGLKATDDTELNSKNSLYIDKEDFDPSLAVHRVTKSQQGLQEYKVYISGESLSHLRTDTLMFFFNRSTDNAYSVKWNETIISTEGDMKNGHSSLRNSPNYFAFDRDLIEENNLLSISTYGLYKTGIEADGVYITNSNVGMDLAQKMDFYGVKLLVLGIGFLISSAFLMVFLYFMNKEGEKGYLFCAVAMMFASIYFVDYLKILKLPFEYLIFKKISLCSLHMSVWFCILTMDRFLKGYRFKHLPGITGIGFIIMSLFVNDFVIYKSLYTYGYFILVGHFAIASIYSLLNLRKSRYAFVFSATFLYTVIYGGLVVIIEYTTSSLKINSPLAYIVIVAAMPVLVAFEELNSKEAKISHEKELRQKEYVKSITDNLTGAWNQRYLYTNLEENLYNSTLGMIDIDDFKAINDNYSHLAGDFILKEFTDLAISTLRKTDDVCRYGGDEFIIILNDCPEDQAYLVMEKLRDRVEKHKFIYEMKVLRITVSIGVYKAGENDTVERAIKKADKALYLSKEKGKNTVSKYQEP